MALEKLKIDEAKALIWWQDVQTEINLTEETLHKVDEIVGETAGEDDDIYKALCSAAQSLRTSWDNMCAGFGNAMEKIKQSIEEFQRKKEEAVDEVKNYESQIGSNS